MRDLFADDMPSFRNLTDEEAGALLVAVYRNNLKVEIWSDYSGSWEKMDPNEFFVHDYCYRLAPVVVATQVALTDDSIDWEQVSPEITGMRRASPLGKAYLYRGNYQIIARAEIFTSYEQGTKSTSNIRRPK